MKVVFMEEVEGTARVGEVKNVADGFARNYLLPRRLAAPANDHYIAIAQGRAEKEARREARLDEEAQTHLVPKMEGSSVSTEVRVGEQGKLFGSVTARDVAQLVQEATGVELEHRQIDLRQPIRETGSHEVTVKLTRNVHVQVVVNVEPLGGEPEAETGEETATDAADAQVEAQVDEAEPVEAEEAVEEGEPAADEPETEAAEAQPEEETEVAEEQPMAEAPEAAGAEPVEEPEAEPDVTAESEVTEAAAEASDVDERPDAEDENESAEAADTPQGEEEEK
jgi:large subunit ribosomal protein L9